MQFLKGSYPNVDSEFPEDRRLPFRKRRGQDSTALEWNRNTVRSRNCNHLCPWFQRSMEVLARPWNGLIMATLERAETLRFAELRQQLPALGDRMLALRLRELESRGLVERRVHPGPPVRVDYRLTEVGRGFREVAQTMSAWGSRMAPLEPERSQTTPDAQAAADGNRAASG